MTQKWPYQEGTWFAIPLRDGGYGSGLVARKAKRSKIIVSYLFGPKYLFIPGLPEVSNKNHESSLQIIMVSSLKLMNGEWPIIGTTPEWKRDLWPMPKFLLNHGSSGISVAKYPEDDPGAAPVYEQATSEDMKLSPDSLYGAGAAEILLTSLLKSPSK
jgi:hypothetical protein